MLYGDSQLSFNILPSFISKLQSKKYSAVFGTRMFGYKSAIKGGTPTYKFIGNTFLTKIQILYLELSLVNFTLDIDLIKFRILRKYLFNIYLMISISILKSL